MTLAHCPDFPEEDPNPEIQSENGLLNTNKWQLIPEIPDSQVLSQLIKLSNRPRGSLYEQQ